MINNLHESVLVNEVVEALHIDKNCKYIDATLGNGGHSLEILKKGGLVLGIDADPKMIEIARNRLGGESVPPSRWKLINGNFTEIDKFAKQNNWEEISGVLFDLGVTNLHLKDMERGFSFENPEAILDMRVDQEGQGVMACDLLNVLREDQLRDLFEVTLETGAAKWITGRVIHLRSNGPIRTVGDMLEISSGLKTGKLGINEATLPFLALRIAVNCELDNLRNVLPKAYKLLKKGGILIVISFHSGEDSIVKDFYKEMRKNGSEIITEKPISANDSELLTNRRARSAKMRVLRK